MTAHLAACLALAAALNPFQDRIPLPKEPADRPGPPLVTAKTWAVCDPGTGAVLWRGGEATPRPIASTTKIMTARIVLRLADRDPKVLDEVVTVSPAVAKTGGSTAGLKAGEKVAVGELLYGLMLPSGNDAAAAFAEHFGSRLPTADGAKPGPWGGFIAEMNRQAAALKMADTHYLDPHGLGRNTSTPADLAKLAAASMKDPRFAKVVGTRRYRGALTTPGGGSRVALWVNTNRLLGIEGYEGVKTGTTTPAGACLVAVGGTGANRLIVVILGATTDTRYMDARNLFRWAWAERDRRP
jgi:D-alanyl-D-alanine carboxypeptidase (penicillin-binding protein 5/6)